MLLIETSTERAMVAIVKGEKLLFHAALPFGFQHSRYLLPQIDAGLKISKIEAIAVGIGPGSYTGMRVGAMTAKTLAYASKIPLVGICTLHTFHAKAPVLIDAKIGGCYLAIGENAAEVLPLDQLYNRLQGLSHLVTPHATPLKAKLDLLYPNNPWQWEELAPNPLRMASLAARKLANGEFTLDGHLELLYLRKTQAEIERCAVFRQENSASPEIPCTFMGI